MNLKRIRSAQKEAMRRLSAEGADFTDEDLAEETENVLAEWAHSDGDEWETFGEPDDTNCLESGRDNCDDWGTGEGAFHGRM